LAHRDLKRGQQMRNASDWLEENTIRARLEQIQVIGTWKLVEKPPDAIPIVNT
jgi:hypothetical protein